MYSRLRTSLKQRTHGQRRTHKQRGGAAWQVFSADRIAKWTANSTLNGDQHLNFVLKPEWANTDDTIKNYITLVERQDELFDYAVKAIAKEIGVDLSKTASADESTILALEKQIIEQAKSKETDKTQLFKYLNDIGKLIYFEATPAAKLQQIQKENLVDLLLNPARVQNRFIQELADIIVLQKKEKAVLDDLKDDTVKYIRSMRYYATAQVNAYAMTSEQLRDGFYLAHPMSEFKTAIATNRTDKTGGFWNQFVFGCTDTGLKNRINTMNVGLKRTLNYGTLAAYIYQYYVEISADKLKEVVLTNLCPTRNSESTTINETTINGGLKPTYPAWLELSKKIIPGLTLLQVLLNIDIEQLQFIVHLIYTIGKSAGEIPSEPASLAVAAGNGAPPTGAVATTSAAPTAGAAAEATAKAAEEARSAMAPTLPMNPQLNLV